MHPQILGLFIPILALMIPIVAMYLKHQRVMAGVEAPAGSKKGVAGQARTLAVLTETLERQHERLRGLSDRVEALEAVLTDAQRAVLAVPRREPATEPVCPPLALPDAPAPTSEAAHPGRLRERA